MQSYWVLHQVRLQHRQARGAGQHLHQAGSSTADHHGSCCHRYGLLPQHVVATRVNFQEPITGCRTTPWCSQSHQAAGLGLPKPKPRQGPLTTASGLPGAATLGINRNNRANLGRILADTQRRTNTHNSWYESGSIYMCGTGSPPRSSSTASGAVLRPAALGPLHGRQHVSSRRCNVTCAQLRVSTHVRLEAVSYHCLWSFSVTNVQTFVPLEMGKPVLSASTTLVGLHALRGGPCQGWSWSRGTTRTPFQQQQLYNRLYNHSPCRAAPLATRSMSQQQAHQPPPVRRLGDEPRSQAQRRSHVQRRHPGQAQGDLADTTT